MYWDIASLQSLHSVSPKCAIKIFDAAFYLVYNYYACPLDYLAIFLLYKINKSCVSLCFKYMLNDQNITVVNCNLTI